MADKEDGKRSDDGSSGSSLVLGETFAEEPAEQVVGHRLQEVVDLLGYRQELRVTGGLDEDVSGRGRARPRRY